MRALYIGLLGSFVLACGGSVSDSPTPTPTDDGGTDATPDATPDLPFPAVTPDLPRVVDSGGPVLATPSVTPVFFPGFDYPTEVLDFVKKIGPSKYWAALSEYGVGQIAAAPAVTLAPEQIAPTDIGNITDDQIQAWVVSRFDGTHPEFGNTPDPNSIYTLFYPASTVISLQGAQSCQSFGGYHGNVTIQGKLVAYAVIPECKSFGNSSAVDVVTEVTSHELSEAATDPFPFDDPKYTQVDRDHLAWSLFLGGGEVGDLCAQFSTSVYKPADIGWVVQKNWSNENAKAGHDPCAPQNEGEAYFNVVPTMSDKILTRANVTTKGVKVPVGESRTIPLALYSDAPTSGPWTVSVQGFSRGGGTTNSPMTFTLDKNTGKNGDVLNLTITAKTAITSQSKSMTFLITSQLGTRRNTYIAMAGN